MSKVVQKLFTEIAPKYDFLNHFMSLSIDRRWREQALDHLKDAQCERILDLCAGTLDLSLGLAELQPEAQIVALDFSLAMLREGQKKIKKLSRCHLVCADGHSIPFSDNSFDAIVCGFGIRNLEMRERAAQEISRVLRPKGTLVVLEFFRPEKIFPKLFYQTYGKFIIPRIGGFFSKNRQAYEYLQNSIQDFLSIGEYETLLRDHGFDQVDHQALSGGIAHEVVATLM